MSIFMDSIEQSKGTKEEKQLKAQILDALSSIVDPEINIDIVNLGLIYDIVLDIPKKEARIKMTLTTPTCPYGPMLLDSINKALSSIEELDEIHVDLVWDPPWNVNMMSDNAKDMLGYYGEHNI